MLAPLVAFIGDVPLERKILFHGILLAMMGRISESVTAVALSEIRPKIVFLERTSSPQAPYHAVLRKRET